MMSLLEGHGDVTMDRAARDLIPNAAHFSQVLRARRESASGLTKFFQQLIGLEAKLRQYADGARFVREIESDRRPGAPVARMAGAPRICRAQRRSRRLSAGCHACGVWRSSQRDAPAADTGARGRRSADREVLVSRPGRTACLRGVRRRRLSRPARARGRRRL